MIPLNFNECTIPFWGQLQIKESKVVHFEFGTWSSDDACFWCFMCVEKRNRSWPPSHCQYYAWDAPSIELSMDRVLVYTYMCTLCTAGFWWGTLTEWRSPVVPSAALLPVYLSVCLSSTVSLSPPDQAPLSFASWCFDENRLSVRRSASLPRRWDGIEPRWKEQ